MCNEDILEAFACRLVANPTLVPPTLKYEKSGVIGGEKVFQNSRRSASLDAELESIHETQENASNPAAALPN